jgi:hypothetical protein
MLNACRHPWLKSATTALVHRSNSATLIGGSLSDFVTYYWGPLFIETDSFGAVVGIRRDESIGIAAAPGAPQPRVEPVRIHGQVNWVCTPPLSVNQWGPGVQEFNALQANAMHVRQALVTHGIPAFISGGVTVLQPLVLHPGGVGVGGGAQGPANPALAAAAGGQGALGWVPPAGNVGQDGHMDMGKLAEALNSLKDLARVADH